MKKGLVLAVVLVLLLLAGCSGNQPIKPQLHLTILRHSWLKELSGEDWFVSITGEAENTGTVEIDYVELWATYYDSADNILTKEYTNEIGIPVGAIWHFEIMYYHAAEPVRYELVIADLTQW